MQNKKLSLFSPLGWVTHSEVFVNDNWWPVVLLASSSITFIGIAFYLRAKRDMFARLFPGRPGQDKSSAFFKQCSASFRPSKKEKSLAFSS